MHNKRTIAWATALVIAQLFVLNACHYPQNQIHEIGCDVNELIDAINTANSNTVQDTILLQPDCTYTLTEVDNQVETGEPISTNGLPAITTPITIQGDRMFPPVIERSSVSGTPEFRIFFISSTGELSLDNLHIANGSTQDAGGGIYNYKGKLQIEYVSIYGCTALNGGGIASVGENELQALALMLYENSAEKWGGGFYNTGTASISGGSSIYENHSNFWGGGVYSSGSLIQDEVSVLYNTATERGGGIFSRGGTLRLGLSTVAGNNAVDGGGLYGWDSSIMIDDSEFRGNQAQQGGGGMHIDGGTLQMQNNTHVHNNNAAWEGGGINIDGLDTLTIEGCLIENNTGGNGGGIHIGYSGDEYEISDTVIEGNQSTGTGGGVSISGGKVRISNGSQIINNSSTSSGGGVYNSHGVFSLVNSSILNNQAGGGGGIESYGEIVVRNSTIASNTATLNGGGLRNKGDTTIINSTVKDNSANSGGGVSIHGAESAEPGTGQLLIVNSTISGNQASTKGGGLFFGGITGSISFSTIAYNDAAEIGGVYVNSGNLEIKNSIVAGYSSENCSSFDMSPLTPFGENISDDTSCIGFTLIADPLLGGLAMNGGSTETHALEPGSPAIDVVPSQDCTTVEGVDVDEDQRGFRRPGKGSTGCDLGAYEASRPHSAPFVPPPPTAFTGKSRMNANCRAGPGTAYNETGFVPEGFTAQIEGRNEESNWLWIQTPNGADHCWVSTIALELDFDPETLTVVASQALPAPAETEPPAETQPPEAQGCTVMQMSGSIKCVVPCPAGAVPGEACTP